MSTHGAEPSTAAPSHTATSAAPVGAGRPRILQAVVLAALGVVSGALLVWQLGPVDLVTGLADAAPAGTLAAWVPRSWRSRVQRSAATLTGALREVRPLPLLTSGQPGRLAAGIGGGLLVTAGVGVAVDTALQAVDVTPTLTQTAVVGLAGTALGSSERTSGGTSAAEASLTTALVAAGVPIDAALLNRSTRPSLRAVPDWVAMTLRARGAHRER